MALDLPDAVIAQLQSIPSVTSAFGDTWSQTYQTGIAKFFTDLSAQVALPYCVITEPGENYQYMTASVAGVINFIATGNMQFSIWASDRAATRQLGLIIAKGLNDAPLAWPNENSTMEFRMMNSFFAPGGDVGPSVPITFNRVFVFEYVWSATL